MRLESWLYTMPLRLRSLFRRRRVEQELSEELQFHLERHIEAGIAKGLTPEEARYAALRAMGGLEQRKEECRDARRVHFVEDFLQDVRYAGRTLRKSPGFAAAAILTLALGIGANTAIFSMLNAVRLRGLPVPNPQELAAVRIVGGNRGMGLNPGRYGGLTRPVWQQIQAQQRVFSGIFAWNTTELRVGQGSELRRAGGIRVSGDFFRVLGVQPWRGRLILPEDEAGACPASRGVVSYSYWQSEMGGRELGAGSKLIVDGELVEVIGVTPPAFFGLAVGETFDIALPYCQTKDLRPNVFALTVMGRLRPGITLPRATAQLDTISAGIFEATALTGYSAKTIETYKRFRLAAYPAAGVSWLRETYDSSLWLLLAITGLVLLTACANLANLMLARASTREREVAVRLALGASRGRLVWQLLAESGLLAVLGGLLGFGVAHWLSRILVWSLSSTSEEVHLPLTTDWRVLLFAAVVTALTCVVFGVAPALRATSAEPVAAMKAGGRGLTGSRERFSLQRLMVVSEIAFSLVLLVGAMLFVRSFRNLISFDPGMREGGITVAFLGFHQSQIPRDRYEQFERDLLEEVRSTPGILSAATTTNVPLVGGSWSHGIRIEAAEGSSRFTWVSPGYFHTMGIALLRGRDFSPSDTVASPRVAVVNQTFIQRFLGGADPLGKTLRTNPEPSYPATVYEIVGVIADTKYNDLRGETPPMTFAASQYPNQGPWAVMMIHSTTTPAMVVAAIKHRIAEKHPEIVLEFSDFQMRVHDGLVRERLMAMLSGFFGLLAALLTTVGLYGVIAYLVTRRRNEIGIRMALGARRGQVVALVMREAGRLVVIGVAIGTVLALVAGRGAGSLLFGLKPYDPLTLVTAGALLAAIAAVASFLPARRAAKLDPMVALRDE